MSVVSLATSGTELQRTRTWRHVLRVIVRDPLSLASTLVIILFILVAIVLIPKDIDAMHKQLEARAAAEQAG